MQEQSGATRQGLPKGKILDFDVPVPLRAEQDRIVAKIDELFSDLDAGVAALERVRANLKRYRAAVLKAAVEGRLTEQWRAEHPDAEPASELLQRILTERRHQWEQDQLAKYEAKGKKPPKGWKDKYKEPVEPEAAELPRLPTGWCWATVQQVADVQGGIQKAPKRAPKNNAYPYLRVANVYRDRLNLAEVHELELFAGEIDRLRLEPGDLLIVEGNGSRSEIGRSALWDGTIEDCVHQNHIIRVRFHAGTPRYLNCYWNSPLGVNRVFQHAASTSGLYTLSVAKVSSLPVPIPPAHEQKALADIVAQQLSKIERSEHDIELALARGSRLRQGILKRAFEGTLVSEVSTAATTEGVAIAANEAPTPRLPLRSRQLAFAAKAVDRLAERIEFGQTQLVKFLYLVQYGLGVSLGITPQQYPRGPFFKAIYEIEKDAAENDIFRHWSRPRRGTLYRKGDKIAEWLTAADDLLGDRKDALDQLLDHFAHMDTDAAELTVTVYAVWNDLLLDGKTWDAEIITQGVHDWHESKRRFTLKEVKARMRWLEANGLKPTGQGLRTEPAEPAGLFEGA